jgi:hypothetical protein
MNEQVENCPVGMTVQTLSEWYDNMSGPEETEKIREHIISCLACQSYLTAYKHQAKLLQYLYIPRFQDRIWSNLHPKENRFMRPSNFQRWSFVGGISALVLTTLFVAFFVYINRGDYSETISTQTITPLPFGKLMVLFTDSTGDILKGDKVTEKLTAVDIGSGRTAWQKEIKPSGTNEIIATTENLVVWWDYSDVYVVDLKTGNDVCQVGYQFTQVDRGFIIGTTLVIPSGLSFYVFNVNSCQLLWKQSHGSSYLVAHTNDMLVFKSNFQFDVRNLSNGDIRWSVPVKQYSYRDYTDEPFQLVDDVVVVGFNGYELSGGKKLWSHPEWDVNLQNNYKFWSKHDLLYLPNDANTVGIYDSHSGVKKKTISLKWRQTTAILSTTENYDYILSETLEGGQNEKVSRVDYATGKVLWEVEVPLDDPSNPGVLSALTPSTVFIWNSSSNRVDAFDYETGNHLWTHRSELGEIAPLIVLYEEMLLVPAYKNYIIWGFDLLIIKDGKLLRSFTNSHR